MMILSRFVDDYADSTPGCEYQFGIFPAQAKVMWLTRIYEVYRKFGTYVMSEAFFII